jgi:hypothetical protein
LLFAKIAQTPLLVPNVLLLAVPLQGGRMLFAVPPPVIPIPGSPFLWAVQAHLAIPGPQRSSGDDTQRDGGAGTRDRSTPIAPADISMAGRSAHSSGIAVRPYRRCRILLDVVVRREI